MYVRLLNWWDSLRNSYWFVPALLTSLACVLSALVFYIELGYTNDYFPYWLQSTPDSARSTLSAIVSAMIAVTGTVFSITIVVLSLTSQQFGPRLLRTFMHDFTTQLTLGIFLSTALYSLISLYMIRSQPETIPVPHLSVLISFLFMFGSTGMLIVFIHHIAVIIQAPYIIESVATDLQAAIKRLFPEQLGETEDHVSRQDKALWLKRIVQNEFDIVRFNQEGYIQAINGDGVLTIAKERNLLVEFFFRPGDFITRGDKLARVSLSTEFDTLRTQLNEAVVVGRRRTPRQDLECTISELVEVAVRSLSPGINDPNTAIQCVDRLTAGLSSLVSRKMPSPYRFDSEGELRVLVPATRFGPVLDAAFSEIRQYSANSVSVTIRLLESLSKLAAVVQREEDREAIARQGEMLRRSAEKFPEKLDVEDAMIRYQNLQSTLERKDSSLRPPSRQDEDSQTMLAATGI